jgi:hypothetical protein
MGAITPKQQAFIRTLLLERASTLEMTTDQVDEFITTMNLNELTSKSASTAIDSIRKIQVKAVGTAHLPPAERTIVNKFANPCALCGHPVLAGAGHALLIGGAWSTYHKEGECSSAPAIVADKVTNESFGTLADGFFALPSSGTNDLVFYAIKTNKGFHNASLKGQRGIYMQVGGRSDEKLRGERGLNAIKRIASLSDDERLQAQALYGQEIGQCGICGRRLTDEVTRKRGIGNDCASRLRM